MKYAKQVCVSLLYCRSNLLDHLGETPQPSATQRERKCKSNVTDIPLRIYTTINIYQSKYHTYAHAEAFKYAVSISQVSSAASASSASSIWQRFTTNLRGHPARQ